MDQSPHPLALAAAYREHNVPSECAAASKCVFRVIVENTGLSTWLRDPPDGHFAGLGFYIDDTLIMVGRPSHPSIAPGERCTIAVNGTLPREPGKHRLRFDMMIRNKTWFSQVGSTQLTVDVDLFKPDPTPTDALFDSAARHNSWFFSPGQGIYRTRAGRPTYPLFAASASGCTITDVDGRQFIDLHMGWGCCLLGYADERIQRAIARSLNSSGVMSLIHQREIEVSEILCKDFGFGDGVLFGKNGSDVTTWAVRTARVSTGRKTVISAGYHGWQDWNGGRLGFGNSGIPEDNNKYSLTLPYGDLPALEKAVAENNSDLSAILIEPAATALHLDDPHHERDREYLQRAQSLARSHKALFILDEIITGFRFRGKSAQAHYDLTPDLTCLGKALANGLPLSALVGRGDLLHRHIGRIFYAPTNKGEVHSFAAAKEALHIHLTEDIPAAVWRAGEQIRAGVDLACKQLGIDGRLVGPPYRMYFGFFDLKPHLRSLPRTLLQQELARHGVISHKGYVVVSSSHHDRAIDKCIAAFTAALQTIRIAIDSPSYIQYLDIPDVPDEGPPN